MSKYNHEKNRLKIRIINVREKVVISTFYKLNVFQIKYVSVIL